MKNLMVIRHAKSSWNVPLNDIERPLEHKGILDAHKVSLKCLAHLPKSYIIYSSTAKRAIETATIFAQNYAYPIDDILFKKELYTFEVNNLEKVIKSFKNDCDNVILFGHNEAITNFVNKFGDIYIENVPTCGFVSLQFNSEDWQNIGKGKTIQTIFPKDLK